VQNTGNINLLLRMESHDKRWTELTIVLILH